MHSLAGKTVLITGASGAVGQACLRLFLDQGARVMMTDRVAPPGAVDPEMSHFQIADVTDPEAMDGVVKAAADRFGQVDAAVLAAGVEGVAARVEDIAEADLDRVLAVNVKGALFALQACLRHMKPRGRGSIVALSSISGVVGSASLAAYTLSKHAVVGLVRAAALESARSGVRINAVCPGPIESPMMQRLDAAMAALDPQRPANPAGAGQGLPHGRYVTAQEVAGMIAFLCGDQSASCHGGTYMVDGGFTAK